MDDGLTRNYRHNFIVNMFDGGFFGAAIGFASFVTVIPLFVSTFTDSAILIGLIPAIHAFGWQLPQLLTANRVSRLRRFLPTALILTIQERVPFLGLALVAWFSRSLPVGLTVGLIYFLLVWQGLGGGFTATAWQVLIGKIIPPRRRGTFFGAQSATANLLASGTAIIAGIVLERLASPADFTICFLGASLLMVASWFCMAATREPESPPIAEERSHQAFWKSLGQILRRDHNFRWFLVARMVSQLSTMAFAFYTVYAVRYHGLNEVAIGLMTAVLMGIQIAANPIMGWLGDHYSHQRVLELGMLAAVLSASLAGVSTKPGWFYLVFSLAGIANVASWTIPMAMVLEFGSEKDRPAYIGLANTLVAPFTFLAPILGGWLADASGYRAAFLVSALAGLITTGILHWAVRDPRHVIKAEQALSGVE